MTGNNKKIVDTNLTVKKCSMYAGSYYHIVENILKGLNRQSHVWLLDWNSACARGTVLGSYRPINAHRTARSTHSRAWKCVNAMSE